MELDLSLEMCPDMIFRVFVCITLMVAVALFVKAAIITSKQSKSKEKKEVESDDNRRNKKISSKNDVH